MVIADSSIQMNSTRIFNQFSSQAVASGLLTNSRFLSDLKGAFDSSKKDTLELSSSMDTGTDLTYDVSAGSRSSRTDNSSLISKRVEELHQIRIQLLQQILGLMQNMSGKKNNFLDKASSALSDLMTMGSGYTSVTTMESYYEETEMTTFEAQGIAHTADGREINFGVSVSMSRKYTEYTSMQVARDIPLLDPLVINVGGGVTNISDQHFYFDLDADGTEENVAGLENGSAFLAYDRNGDGIINNGLELFGAKSGNGFADLSEFDIDGNGWIDESDAVFDMLKVWYKDEQGQDKLIGLKEADVGAIYLDRADTEFTSHGMDLLINGRIRQTGMFLRESGGIGTVQQVDLAVEKI